MKIRPAVRADLPAILELERGSPTAPHWGEQVYQELLAGPGEGDLRRVLLVAAEGKSLCGYAVGKALGAESELESVVVAPSEQRRRVGGQLCRAVVEWAYAAGARGMDLEVRAGSDGAQRLYRGLGFVELARRPGYYREPVEDAIVMRCQLALKACCSIAEAEV